MQNPLAKYLSDEDLPQAKFAKRGPWRQATVSGWCNGTIPKITDALAIERATGGTVSVADWAEYTSSLSGHAHTSPAPQPKEVNSELTCGGQVANTGASA